MTSYLMFATHTVSSSGAGAGSGSDHRTDGTAVSSTTTYYSKKFRFSKHNAIGWSLMASGTMTGTFTLQYSDVEAPNEATDTDWSDASAPTITNPAGSSVAMKKYSATDLRGKWFRLKYVNASGSGTIYGYADGSL